MPVNSKYAVITGASGGLGKAFSVECALRGYGVILTDLPGTPLHHLANFIRSNYGVAAISVESDLSHNEECYSLYEYLKERKISISMLVNNAGVGGTHYFQQQDIHYYSKQISLNAAVPTILTRIFLNDLVNSADGGYILNVASLAGFFHLPGKQVYGATKSYLLSFSRTLRKELKPANVHVSVLCPGGINTNLQMILKHRNCSWLSRRAIMDPQEVASVAIRGLLSKKELIIPGLLNRFSLWLDRILPAELSDKFSEKQMKIMMIDCEEILTDVVHLPGAGR
jgi:uncharacterized protein